MNTAGKYLPILTGLFVACLLISNTIEAKVFTAFGLTLTAGTIIFPLAYIFGDVLTEVYGYAASRKVIWTGFAALALMVLTYTVAIWLPPAQDWPHQDAFATIFSAVPRISAASLIAYFTGEFVNSYIVAKLKVRTGGNYMAGRFLASTLFGQGVDTIVFTVIAFAGTMSGSALVELIASMWLIKVLWETFALPLTLMVARWLKRAENMDVYDRGTDFNPFRFEKG